MEVDQLFRAIGDLLSVLPLREPAFMKYGYMQHILVKPILTKVRF